MQDFGTFTSFLAPTDLIPIRGMPTFIRDRGIFYTGNPNNEGPIEGGFDVWEAFVEAIVPIVQTDDGGVDLHMAARYADYEGSGGVWAGKFGGDWQINEAVRFRGTWSRDTRAGSLSERFDTQTGGTQHYRSAVAERARVHRGDDDRRQPADQARDQRHNHDGRGVPAAMGRRAELLGGRL